MRSVVEIHMYTYTRIRILKIRNKQDRKGCKCVDCTGVTGGWTIKRKEKRVDYRDYSSSKNTEPKLDLPIQIKI